MATVGIRIRSAVVTASVLLVTASWLASTQPATGAAAPAPSSSTQPSPTPQPTTNALTLTLDPTSVRPGGPVAVSFEGWKSDTCFLYYDAATTPTGSCTSSNGVLTGSLTVPADAAANTAVPVTACPTTCTADNFTATAPLDIEPALVTSQPTGSPAGAVLPTKPRPRHRHHRTATAPAATSSRTSAFVVGGAAILFIGAVLGLLRFRRRPPAPDQRPRINLVPRPDPGIVTADPAAKPTEFDTRITIRLRPDVGRTRVEAMQR